MDSTRHGTVGTVAFAAALLASLAGLTACAGQTTAGGPGTPRPASSDTGQASLPASVPASPTPVEDPAPGTDLTGTAAAQYVRAAITGFQETVQSSGAVTYILSDVAGKNVNNFTVTAESAGSRKSVYETGAKEQYFWDGATQWTQVLYLNDEMKKIVKQVNPDAKFYSEPVGANVSISSPERTAEAFLAFAKNVSCTPDTAGTTCTVDASGIAQIPGLGTFTTPQENVKAVLTVNSDGVLTDVTVFPDVPDMERRFTKVTFGPQTVTMPAADTTVTMEQVTTQAIVNDEASKSASPSPQPSDSAAAAPDGSKP
jgi:hypothetical protein